MNLLDDIDTDGSLEDHGPGVGVARGLAIGPDNGDGRSRSHLDVMIDPIVPRQNKSVIARIREPEVEVIISRCRQGDEGKIIDAYLGRGCGLRCCWVSRRSWRVLAWRPREKFGPGVFFFDLFGGQLRP